MKYVLDGWPGLGVCARTWCVCEGAAPQGWRYVGAALFHSPRAPSDTYIHTIRYAPQSSPLTLKARI